MYNTNQTINNGIITDKAISFEKTLPKMDVNKNKTINEANKILFFWCIFIAPTTFQIALYHISNLM